MTEARKGKRKIEAVGHAYSEAGSVNAQRKKREKMGTRGEVESVKGSGPESALKGAREGSEDN